MKNLLKSVDIRRIQTRDAGTPGTIDCDIIDMSGFDEVTFIAGFQTVVNDAIVTLQVAQSDENDTGEMVVSEATTGAITSDGTTIALSGKQLAVSVVKPTKRYLEAQLVIADQNAPVDYVIAILSNSRSKPTSQGSTVQSSAIFANPAAA